MRARAHQPLQPACQVPAPSHRACLARERRATQGALRPGGRRHLHTLVLGGDSRPGRSTPTPRSCRTNLASLILQMAALGLGVPEEFPFVDPPDTRLLNDGYRLLQELSAVDGDRRIARVGREMAALPVDPRLARVLLEAGRQRCLTEALVIAAFLSIQDPRERPSDKTEAADQAHRAVRRRTLRLRGGAQPLADSARTGGGGDTPAAPLVQGALPVVRARTRVVRPARAAGRHHRGAGTRAQCDARAGEPAAPVQS